MNEHIPTYFCVTNNEPGSRIFMFQFQQINQRCRSVPRDSSRLEHQETPFILGSTQLQTEYIVINFYCLTL